jgi:hypothetical protein
MRHPMEGRFGSKAAVDTCPREVGFALDIGHLLPAPVRLEGAIGDPEMRPIAMQLKTRTRFRCGSLSIDARCASNPRRTLRKVSTRICDRASSGCRWTRCRCSTTSRRPSRTWRLAISKSGSVSCLMRHDNVRCLPSKYRERRWLGRIRLILGHHGPLTIRQ